MTYNKYPISDTETNIGFTDVINTMYAVMLERSMYEKFLDVPFIRGPIAIWEYRKERKIDELEAKLKEVLGWFTGN